MNLWIIECKEIFTNHTYLERMTQTGVNLPFNTNGKKKKVEVFKMQSYFLATRKTYRIEFCMQTGDNFDSKISLSESLTDMRVVNVAICGKICLILNRK